MRPPRKRATSRTATAVPDNQLALLGPTPSGPPPNTSIAAAAEPEKLVSRDFGKVTTETTSLVSGPPEPFKACTGPETVGGDRPIPPIGRGAMAEPAPARPAQNATITDALTVIARRASVPVEIIREAWSERAAIREHLGEQRRTLAEREAIGDLEEMFPPAPRRPSAKGAHYVPDGDQYW